MEYHTFSQKDDLLCRLKNYEQLKRFVEIAVSCWLRMHLKLAESAWLSSSLSSLSPQLLGAITLDVQEFIESHERQNLELTREDLYWAIDEICKSIFISPNPDGDNTKSPKHSNVNKFLKEFFCKESMLERIDTNSAKNLYAASKKLIDAIRESDKALEKILNAIHEALEEPVDLRRVTIPIGEMLQTNLGDKVMTNKQERNRPLVFEIFVSTSLHVGSGTPEHNSPELSESFQSGDNDIFLHIGSGTPEHTSTSTYPYVPGSSLKGVIRSLAERLSGYMNYDVHSTDADDWKTATSVAETLIPLRIRQTLPIGSVKNIPEKSAFENTPDFTYRQLKKWLDYFKAIHDDRKNIGIVISPKAILEDGVTTKPDIFAVGIVLYEMLADASPFASTILDILKCLLLETLAKKFLIVETQTSSTAFGDKWDISARGEIADKFYESLFEKELTQRLCEKLSWDILKIQMIEFVSQRHTRGKVTGLLREDFRKFKIVVYVLTDQWYIHPCAKKVAAKGEGRSAASPFEVYVQR